MRPSERGDVRKNVGWAVQTGAASFGDDMAEMQGVPVDDDGSEEVELTNSALANSLCNDLGQGRQFPD